MKMMQRCAALALVLGGMMVMPASAYADELDDLLDLGGDDAAETEGKADEGGSESGENAEPSSPWTWKPNPIRTLGVQPSGSGVPVASSTPPAYAPRGQRQTTIRANRRKSRNANRRVEPWPSGDNI